MSLKRLCLPRMFPVWIGLSLLLSACASTEQVIVTKTERELVPESLLVPCPRSEGATTYQEAVELAIKRGAELTECNKRLDDIRAWSGSVAP